ncbi:MAG: hypothetical protein NZ555_06910 [Geminicoccaceae bacterium]|nr:hypothetical protein [Geminicoccaceae bacterium]
MAEDFPLELRLTALVLGCAGRKALCARLRAVNPTTRFDLERAHTWMQGRAVPRSDEVYSDWARVLGSTRPGRWLADCPLEAFEEELRALFGSGVAALAAEIGAARRAFGTGRGSARIGDGEFDLAGHYACYSHAWSPHYRGQVIRGSLAITAGRRGDRDACYTERLLGRDVLFTGPAQQAGRTLHALLQGPAGVSPLFLSVLTPGPPGSVLCGILSGATAVGPEPLPSATRIVLVRVPAAATPSNRYFAPEAGAFAADLAALGLAGIDEATVERAIRAALAGGGSVAGHDQVTLESMTALATALDVAWFGPWGEESRRFDEVG